MARLFLSDRNLTRLVEDGTEGDRLNVHAPSILSPSVVADTVAELRGTPVEPAAWSYVDLSLDTAGPKPVPPTQIDKFARTSSC